MTAQKKLILREKSNENPVQSVQNGAVGPTMQDLPILGRETIITWDLV